MKIRLRHFPANRLGCTQVVARRLRSARPAATPRRRSHRRLQPLQVAFWRVLILPVALCLLLSGCQPAAIAPQGITVQVQRVVSGDTLEVTGTKPQANFVEQVQLIGVDAPELGQQPWGSAARAFLKQKIDPANPTVLLEMDVQPMDGNRRLAYLWIGNTLVNEAILAEGHALLRVSPPNTRHAQRLRYAQDRARQIGLGIWNPVQPLRLTPAQFRSQFRNS